MEERAICTPVVKTWPPSRGSSVAGLVVIADPLQREVEPFLLPAQRCQVEIVVGRVELVTAPQVGGVAVEDAGTLPDERADARRHRPTPRLDRDVEVAVEVGPVGGHPGN